MRANCQRTDVLVFECACASVYDMFVWQYMYAYERNQTVDNMINDRHYHHNAHFILNIVLLVAERTHTEIVFS